MKRTFGALLISLILSSVLLAWFATRISLDHIGWTAGSDKFFFLFSSHDTGTDEDNVSEEIRFIDIPTLKMVIEEKGIGSPASISDGRVKELIKKLGLIEGKRLELEILLSDNVDHIQNWNVPVDGIHSAVSVILKIHKGSAQDGNATLEKTIEYRMKNGTKTVIFHSLDQSSEEHYEELGAAILSPDKSILALIVRSLTGEGENPEVFLIDLKIQKVLGGKSISVW